MTASEEEQATVLLAAGSLARENRLLRRIIDVTSSRRDVREVANQVASLVTETTGADVCFVHVVDEERNRLVLAGATPPFDEVAGTVVLAMGEGLAGWVAVHGEVAVVPDKWKDARYRYIPELRGEDYAALVSVPMLLAGSRVVGVLNVHAKDQSAFPQGDVVLLSQVANLLAQVVDNARLVQRLEQREAALETFAARTVEAQELERRRLAGEIHDGISQRLISLWYRLLATEDDLDDPAAARRELAAAKELATSALQEARTAIAGLRPPVLDDLGLGPSLESLGRSLSGIDVDVDVEPTLLPPHVELALYRIAQEALQNVVKHAGASCVSVSLAALPDRVRLAISDDGCGFDPAATGDPSARFAYGLAGMRERAELIGAELVVTSRSGEGSTVQVELPLPAAADQAPGT